jgi:hypothetical protein
MSSYYPSNQHRSSSAPSRLHIPKGKGLLKFVMIVPLLAVVAISALGSYSLIKPDVVADTNNAPTVISVHPGLMDNTSALSASLGAKNVMTLNIGDSVEAQAVPEPSSWALGIIVAACFGIFRARRTKV